MEEDSIICWFSQPNGAPPLEITEERLRELVKLSGGAEPVAQAEKSLPAGIEWRALGRAFAGKKAPAPPAPKLVMRPIPPPAPPPLR